MTTRSTAVRVVSYEPALGSLDMWEWLWKTNPNYQPPRFLDEGETYTEPSEIPSNKINWFICGGETGPGARPMNPEWAIAIKNQCANAGVPFFFKSWGEWWQPPSGKTEALSEFKNPFYDHKTGTFRVTKKKAGRLLDRKEWNEIPDEKPRLGV